MNTKSDLLNEINRYLNLEKPILASFAFDLSVAVKDCPFASEQTSLKAAFEFAKMGYDRHKIVSLTKDALIVCHIAGIDVESSTKTIADAMNSLKTKPFVGGTSEPI